MSGCFFKVRWVGGYDKKMFRVGVGKSEAALVKNVLSCGGWFFKSEGP